MKTYWWSKPRGRHPTDRRPAWLQILDAEVSYWLTATSRKRHGEPFNKREAGFKRRQQRRLKSIMRSEEGCEQ